MNFGVKPHGRGQKASSRFVPIVERLEERLTPGRINPPAPGPMPGGTGGTHATVNYGYEQPNNDNSDQKQNFVSRDLVFNNIGYIDIVYDVTNSNGVNEFWMEDNIRNATGKVWGRIVWDLGFGTGANFDQPMPPSDHLDFDLPHKDPWPGDVTHNPGMAFFGLYTGDAPHWFDLTQGVYPKNGQVAFFYTIDVPDSNDPWIPAAAKTATGYRFTLRVSVEELPGGGGRIGGRAWFDTNGDGIQDGDESGFFLPLEVLLHDADGNVVATTYISDPDGTYEFTDLAPGTYRVAFFLPSGYTATLRDQGEDDTLDSDFQAGEIFYWAVATDLFDLGADQTIAHLDAGVVWY